MPTDYTVIRRKATAQYATETGETGKVEVNSDFLQDETEREVTIWLKHMAWSAAARTLKVPLTTVTITSFQLEQ